MHERKAEMARFADAFIALPGMAGLFSTVLVHNSFLADLIDGHRIPNLTRSLGVTLQAAMELWKSCLRSSPGRN